MRNLKSKLLALGSVLLCAITAVAQDSGPLIDLLLKKGVIDDTEAEELRAELVKDFVSNTPAGKLNLGSTVKGFRLTGDLRVRYQYDNEVQNFAPTTVGANNDRSRYRYRFRFGPTVSFSNNWSAGFRLETANGATSTNDDFAAAGSTNFAKDGNTAYVGQAWI
jgi:Putative porin